MKTKLTLILILAVLGLPIMAQNWLTIYNDDLSLVRTQFQLELKKGRQSYNFDQITARIDPASVIVKSKDNSVIILEQNYEFDLAGTNQILLKYLDREISILTQQGSNYTGTLKFFDSTNIGLIEKSTNRLIIVNASEIENLQLAELPANFYTRPTLHWRLDAPKTGKFPMQMTYLTGGLSWDVTYNTVWDGKKLLFNAWVTIRNTSGKAFDDVTLKLIAGEVNRIRQAWTGGTGRNMMDYDTVAAEYAPKAMEFEEKEFHDFHLYTLDEKVSFANNQTKQIQLFPTKTVVAEAVYEYNLFGSAVNSIIRFKNTKENGIGIPLPKGTIKVYKEDSDGNQEFIGEDSINHTGRNEEIRINTGKAFDLVGKTLVTSTKQISNRVSEKTIQITLRNNSKEKKTIDVVYRLPATSRILSVSPEAYKYEIDSDRKVTFKIEIEPDKEVIFSFVERSEW
ncbi:MAG: DUF4139 domain-containing protein [Candidatus Cloacimonetes bacterium]|nr:DUF4139 domain-containing protein [Candidatus Cloacimonadota bacterium]